MRGLLMVSLVLLFIWLHEAHRSDVDLHGGVCDQVPSASAQAASLLLSPMSLYTWAASTLVRVLLAAPTLILHSLYYSLLLLLAAPWAGATLCLGAVLSGVQVAVYLLHLGLVVAAVAIVALTRHKMAAFSTCGREILFQQETRRRDKAGLRAMLGQRVALQG